MLNILDGVDLRGLGHNSPAYLHSLIEAMKLAFADREYFYGDPRFVDVPMEALLSADYAALRRSLCRAGEAWPGSRTTWSTSYAATMFGSLRRAAARPSL